MIGGLRPYPAMKDSGVSWLGEVPAHWDTIPLKRWVNVNRSVLPESTFPEYIFRYLDIGAVGTGTLAARPQRLRFASAPSRARRVVREGDTIVSTVRTYLKAVYFVDGDSEDIVCSTGFAVLTPASGTIPKFVSYLCLSSAFTDRVTANSIGIAYPAIAETKLRSFRVAVPLFSEQAAIVRFLDHVDRRIRRYVRAKQKLIKLLEEQKQAIIHRAVTRGLDPDVRLKPSDVEWLGEVPEHWEVRPLKFLSPQVTVGIVIQPARLYVKSGVPCLRSLNISSGVIQNRQIVFITQESNRAHRKSQIFAGDLVIVRTGRAGIAAIVTPEFDGANCIDLLIVRASARLDSKFLLAYLNSWAARTDVEYRSVGAIQAHFNTSTLGNLIVPVPPLEEQQAILDAISEQISPLHVATTTAASEISLLHEYRTRLIADVVTGKLDVRAVAAQLPEEADESESVDLTDAESEPEEDGVGEVDGVLEEAEV